MPSFLHEEVPCCNSDGDAVSWPTSFASACGAPSPRLTPDDGVGFSTGEDAGSTASRLLPGLDRCNDDDVSPHETSFGCCVECRLAKRRRPWSGLTSRCSSLRACISEYTIGPSLQNEAPRLARLGSPCQKIFHLFTTVPARSCLCKPKVRYCGQSILPTNKASGVRAPGGNASRRGSAR
jgi:hypothetical protein